MDELNAQLRKVKDLIKDPEHWTTGAWARNKNNIATWATNSDACKFCLLGAIRRALIQSLVLRAGVEIYDFYAVKALEAAIHKHLRVNEELADVNDLQGHSAVMELLDKAIEATK